MLAFISSEYSIGVRYVYGSMFILQTQIDLSVVDREVKERIKKTKDEKKAKKAEVMAKTSKSSAPMKGVAGKAAMPKGPKLGGGGGKR
jgi:flagellar biosynthesis/type III secretory pathway ATPase